METQPQPPVENPPALSSDTTVIVKFLLPAIFAIVLCPALLSGALSGEEFAWKPVLLASAVFLILIFNSLSIKFVEIKGDHLSISNSFKACLVPARHLYFIEVDRDNRAPSITLYFNPPTPFGKAIRITPPLDWKRVGFDRAARWLQPQPNCRSSHPF